jgi:hypothetical protein
VPILKDLIVVVVTEPVEAHPVISPACALLGREIVAWLTLKVRATSPCVSPFLDRFLPLLCRQSSGTTEFHATLFSTLAAFTRPCPD